jgi:hypothetical protein
VRQPTFPTGRSTATPPSTDAIIAAIAALQHGLITFRQLLAAGLTDSAITKRVARGLLHRVHRGVYAVGVVALSREARWHAATLAAGEGAALGLLSAGTLHEISRFRSPSSLSFPRGDAASKASNSAATARSTLATSRPTRASPSPPSTAPWST